MSKHTPGPWTVFDNTIAVGVTTPGADVAHCHRYPHGFDGNRPVEEARANARLIAAAPDLLEALKNLAESYDDRMTDEENAEWYEVYTTALAAIAKAEGAP